MKTFAGLVIWAIVAIWCVIDGAYGKRWE